MTWTREVYELPDGHGWRATPGHRILVLDRGAVVLEYPEAWSVTPGSSQTDIRDAATEVDSSCVLAVSYLRLPEVDLTGLPLTALLAEAVGAGDQEVISQGPVVEAGRDGLELLWTEVRVVDPAEHREARTRMGLGRGSGLQCLITFAFWPEDAARLSPVWDHALRSLRLGARVDDPVRGRRIE